jgi:hypothetical protein
MMYSLNANFERPLNSNLVLQSFIGDTIISCLKKA